MTRLGRRFLGLKFELAQRGYQFGERFWPYVPTLSWAVWQLEYQQPPPAGGTFESIIDECSSRLVGSTVYILMLRTASEGEGGHGKADVVREVA